MFSFFEQNQTWPFMNVPFVGPMREHQEKWRTLLNSWLALMGASSGFVSNGTEFASQVTTSLPELFAKMMDPNAPLTILKGFDESLKHLDRAWEKVMRTEAYAKNSALFLEKYLDFHKAFQEVGETLLSATPIASHRQLQEVGERLNEMEQRLEAMQAKVAAALQEQTKAAQTNSPNS